MIKYLSLLCAVLWLGCCEPSMGVPQPAFVPMPPDNTQLEQPQVPTNYPLMVRACPGCGGPPQFNTFRVIPLGGDFFQFRSP